MEQFDAEANWVMIRSLLETGNVERIFLDRKHIQKIRRYLVGEGILTAEEVQRIFPLGVGEQIWEMNGVVHHLPSHHHHIHVRVRCGDVDGVTGTRPVPDPGLVRVGQRRVCPGMQPVSPDR